jgi:hypothetical protein
MPNQWSTPACCPGARYKAVFKSAPSINAKPSPQAAPESASLAVRASVIEIIARLPALGAISSPNSRVRCATEKEIAP